MPGAYRLVIKGHNGNQIGVLTAYESLTYEKLQNRVGNAVLVANYGVTAATDALLDELQQDIILEVQRHPDLTDSSLDWYVDWIGFCEPPEEGITVVNTQRKTWRFQHANRLLQQNLVHPRHDGVTWYDGQKYSLDRDLTTGLPRNILRRFVRRHCVDATDSSRRIPALYVEDDEAVTSGVGLPGWVHPTPVLEQNYESINTSHVWQGQIAIGLEDIAGLDEVQKSADGDTWTNEYNWYTPWAMATFDDTGGERLYLGYGNYGSSPFYGGVRRSAVGAYGGWAQAWLPASPNYAIQLVCALAEHGGRLYAGTGWGSYLLTGNYHARGQIWRCLANDGTTWAQVHDGNPGGTATIANKHQAVEALISWNGYIYAGVSYYYGTRFYSGNWGGGRDTRGIIMRSQTGDAGTWATVHTVYGAWIEDDSLPDATVVRGPVDGVCCFAAFGTYLYAGVGDRIYPHARDGRIYRTNDGTTWEQVFGGAPGSVDAFIAEEVETPQYSSAGVTWLQVFNGALWAGCGGPEKGDGEVWYTTDGTTWIYAFDQRGYEAMTCHSLTGFDGDLYACFGYSPVGPGSTFNQGYGYVWRMTGDGTWDPPDWAQEGGAYWTGVLEVLQGVADSTLDTEGGTDFGLEPIDLGGNLQEFIFHARSPWGTDRRSTSSDPTIFGVNRGNMANPVYKMLKGNRPTVVYALGVGQGDNRAVIEMKDPARAGNSPWGRWETAVNIQGVDTRGELWQQAAKVREGEGPAEVFIFDILETPSCRKGAEWDVGDLATAVHNGQTYHVKITGATTRLGSNPVTEEIDAEILLLETG